MCMQNYNILFSQFLLNVNSPSIVVRNRRNVPDTPYMKSFSFFLVSLLNIVERKKIEESDESKEVKVLRWNSWLSGI